MGSSSFPKFPPITLSHLTPSHPTFQKERKPISTLVQALFIKFTFDSPHPILTQNEFSQCLCERQSKQGVTNFFVQCFIKGAWGYYCSPLLVIFHLANFHQIFDLRDLISTYSFIQGFYSKRSDCTKNLPDFKANTQNRQKLYWPCLSWQGYLYLDSL